MLFQLVVNLLFGTRNVLVVSEPNNAKKIPLTAALIMCLTLASCDQVQNSKTKGPTLLVSDIAEQYLAKKVKESQWQSPKALIDYPYAIYTDEEGLTSHHQEIIRITQNIDAFQTYSDVGSVHLEELMLVDEMSRYFGFLTVMERFPHRFLLSDPHYSEMKAFIETYESEPSQKQALPQLVRWLNNQESALTQGAKQNIIHSAYSVKKAVESLENIIRTLAKKSETNKPLAELLLVAKQHHSSLIKYQRISKTQIGLWQMPNGADWYHAQFSFRTQTDQKSEVLYQRGMQLPKLVLKSSSKDDMELSVAGLKNAIAEAFNKNSMPFNHCDSQLDRSIEHHAALYHWLSSTCVLDAIKKELHLNTDVQHVLAQFRQGENVIPLFLQIASRVENNTELLRFFEQYRQSMLALATIELGLHKYGWSISYAEQFLIQRSLLSPKAINIAIYDAIARPGAISSTIARYEELTELIDMTNFETIKMEVLTLVITPASQWPKAIATNHE